jgi:hypothetical protein
MMKKTMLLASAAMIGVGFFAAQAKAQGVPQIVEFAKVDVHELSAGYPRPKSLVEASSTMPTKPSVRLTTSL